MKTIEEQIEFIKEEITRHEKAKECYLENPYIFMGVKSDAAPEDIERLTEQIKSLRGGSRAILEKDDVFEINSNEDLILKLEGDLEIIESVLETLEWYKDYCDNIEERIEHDSQYDENKNLNNL